MLRAAAHAALVACFLALLPGCPAAQDQVLLRIEGGTHLRRVENLFSDAARGQIVSTSTEGTIRLWDAETGVLRRTILVVHPEIGTIQKAGLSLSGALLGIGVSGSQGDEEYLYLYDLASDAPPSVLRVPDQVSAVAFAHDGTAVAVATWDTVRAYSLPHFRPLFEDRFSDVVWGLDFSVSGMLAAGSFKGEVRLYDRDLRRVGAGTTGIGEDITDLKFSPDGTRLAVAFNSGDGNEVLAVPGLDVEVEYARPVGQPDLRRFDRVAWAPDGSSVLSSAVEERPIVGDVHRFYILEWMARPGGAAEVALPGVGSMLNFAVVPTAGAVRAIVVGFWDGTVYRAEGRAVRWWSPTAKASISQSHARGLLLSHDGTSVALEGPDARESFRLDLLPGQLTPGDAAGGLDRPLLSSPALLVEDPLSHDRFRLNGKPPALNRWESVSAWAIEPDGTGIVLATRFRIMRLDGDGGVLWSITPGVEAWLVNVSRDGRYAVAGMGDGTIRWFDLRSGAHLFSVFVHAGLQGWVAWTEDGRFTGPRAAWSLLRPYQADASRPEGAAPVDPGTFYHAYHAPDLLRRILAPSGARPGQQ